MCISLERVVHNYLSLHGLFSNKLLKSSKPLTKSKSFPDTTNHHDLNDFVGLPKVLLLFSGGIDSSVLLAILIEIYPTEQIHLLHINYRLRGRESDNEAEVISTLAKKKQIKLYQFEIDLSSSGLSGNVQGRARTERYQKAIEVCLREEIHYVFTAHHQDDMVETFMLNLFKGKSPKSLNSMADDDQDELTSFLPKPIKLCRPLKWVNKYSIVEYAQNNQITFVEDSSNNKNEYERNFLRNIVFPQLTERFSHWQGNLLQTLDYLRISNNIVENAIEKWITSLPALFHITKKQPKAIIEFPGFILKQEFYDLPFNEQIYIFHFGLIKHFPERRFSRGEILAIIKKLDLSPVSNHTLTEIDGDHIASTSLPRLDKKLFCHPDWGVIYFSRGWIAPSIEFIAPINQVVKVVKASTINFIKCVIITIIIKYHNCINNNVNVVRTNYHYMFTSSEQQSPRVVLENVSLVDNTSNKKQVIIELSSKSKKIYNDVIVQLVSLNNFISTCGTSWKKIKIGKKNLKKHLEAKKYPCQVRKSLLLLLVNQRFIGVIDPWGYHRLNDNNNQFLTLFAEFE